MGFRLKGFRVQGLGFIVSGLGLYAVSLPGTWNVVIGDDLYEPIHTQYPFHIPFLCRLLLHYPRTKIFDMM